MREAGAAGPKDWESGQAGPSTRSTQEDSLGPGQGEGPNPRASGVDAGGCAGRGAGRLGRDLPLEGAGAQRLHQAPLGCPRPVCPGSLQAISARPSPQTEAGTPGAHPSLLPQ